MPKPKIEFFDKLGRRKHVYKVDGEIIPSVTTILGMLDKPALIPWAVNMTVKYVEDTAQENFGAGLSTMDVHEICKDAKKNWRKVKSEAASIGTEVHELAEMYFAGAVPEDLTDRRPEVIRAYNGFLEWAGSMDMETIVTEEAVCYKDQYAGTVDWRGTVGGRSAIIDFKTSKGIYPEMYLQLAAYAQAVEWINTDKDWKCKVEDFYIIRFDKVDGSHEVKPINRSTINKLMPIYNSLVESYNGIKWLKEELKK